MSCPKSILISAYLDEELQASDRAALESHLQGCAQCGAALRGMQSLRAAFANAERHQAPYGFSARVMARTAELRSPSPYPLPSGERVKVRGWFVPILTGFAEAAILLMVITVGILAGRIMTDSSAAAPAANIASSLSLDLFDAAPPGSLGGVYLAMTEANNEK
ncbi:MAG: anti-sigma factor family protein [Nitrospirota bacterium]